MGAIDATTERYRPEIDGLRALAVVSVIVNHLDRSLAPFGHLGVDIFFVISGYVITSSVFFRNRTTLLALWSDFYARRFKRLFPALAFNSVVTALAISLVDADAVASLRTGLASLFGLSNIYLYKQATDYFGVSSAINAFTQTWSLGVEEQFYLLFPLAVWATAFGAAARGGVRRFAVLVGVLSVASVAASLYWTSRDQPAAFFLLPMRFWELGLGAALFCVRKPLAARIGAYGPALSAVSLALLVAFLFVDAGSDAVSTLLVAGLTATAIASLQPRGLAYRLLTAPPVNYLGKISYSLYLWHWSALVLGRWTIGVTGLAAPLLLALMLGLAAVSYHFLESPLRRAKWSVSTPRSAALGLASFAAVAALFVGLLAGGHARLFAGVQRNPNGERPAVSTSCAPAHGTLIFVGDSHSTHFTQLAADVAEKFDECYHVISGGFTPFPWAPVSSSLGGLTRERNRESAASTRAELEATLRDLPRGPFNVAVLSSFYRGYFETPLGAHRFRSLTNYDEAGNVISQQAALDNWLSAVRDFARRNPELQIVVFLSTPEMPDIYALPLCETEWFRPRPAANCAVETPRAATLALLAPLDARIVEAVAHEPNVRIFDPTPSLCPEGQTVCRSEQDGERLWADEDHLTEAGARRVEPSFERFLIEQGLVARP